jgi:hypothetical protein
MRYNYTPPIKEIHQVSWNPEQFPGIYKKKEKLSFSGNTILCDELSDFLNEITENWEFRYEEDYGDVSATLVIPSAIIAEKFIEKASKMSQEWSRIDHESKEWRVFHIDDNGEKELLRSHKGSSYQIEIPVLHFIRRSIELEVKDIKKIRQWIHSCENMKNGEAQSLEYLSGENETSKYLKIVRI